MCQTAYASSLSRRPCLRPRTDLFLLSYLNSLNDFCRESSSHLSSPQSPADQVLPYRSSVGSSQPEFHRRQQRARNGDLVHIAGTRSAIKYVIRLLRAEDGCRREGAGANVSVVAVPEGTITGAHYLRTPNYIQITGRGQLTALNIQAGDQVRRRPSRLADRVG